MALPPPPHFAQKWHVEVLLRIGTKLSRGYDLFFEMLSTTFEAAELASVDIEDVFPALVDFTAALAIALSGEEGTDAVIDRLRRRADHWRSGHIQVRTRSLQ